MQQLQSMLARRHTRLMLALLAPGAACWLQSLVWDQIQPRIWFFFYPAVFTSIVLGGLRAGVAATLLSGGLAVWFFMEPRYSLKLSHLPDGLGLLEFLLMGIGVSWWSDRQDRRWALLLQTQRERADYASRFQVLFEQAPVGVALIDSVDGRILELNARFAEIAGRSLAEMRALDWMRITHPDDVQEDLDNMARLNAGEIARFQQEKRYLKPDGSLAWVGMTVAPVKVAEGERLRHLCMVEDITEIRLQLEALAQAREQLAQEKSEQRLRLATEAAGAGIWCWDIATDRFDWSPLCRQHLALPPDATPGYAHFLSVLHPDDRAATDQLVRDALQQHQDYVTEYRIVQPDGGYRWIRAMGRGIFGAAGQATAMLGITLDITQRKQHELNLIASERRFRDLFEYMPIAYQSLDREGRWLDANQKLADLLGIEKPQELLGQNFVDYWADTFRDQFETKFEEFKRTHGVEGRLFLCRADGRPITVQITGRIQCDNEGRFLCTHSILLDVTEREALEQQIMKMNLDLEQKVAERTDQLKTALEAKGLFLASMSHEIRTPMSAVLGIAQLLEEEPLPEEAKGMVRRMRAAGHSLLTILNDILDFSKIEAGELAIERRPFKLEEMLHQIDSLMGGSARERGLELWVDDRTNLNGRLRGDALRLEQVLLNLVSNAVKFTHVGGVTLRVKPLEVLADQVRLRFEVEDTGIGMLPEQVAGLFQAYRQADGSIARRFGGTGLGLTISKQLVELMGGAIGVDSEAGKGSTFWVELPFGRMEDIPLPETTPHPTDSPSLDGLRVLVADDAQLNRFVAEKALTKRGAKVTLAVDGQAALERLRGHPADFDLVLMDVQMPVMNGLEAARRIRRELQLTRLPIIALTAGVMAEEQQAALDAGMTDFMAKPMDLNQLSDMIRRHCPSASPET